MKRTSKFPYAFTAIGFAKRDMGDTDGALAAFNKAIKLDPSDYEPAYWAGDSTAIKTSTTRPSRT